MDSKITWRKWRFCSQSLLSVVGLQALGKRDFSVILSLIRFGGRSVKWVLSQRKSSSGHETTKSSWGGGGGEVVYFHFRSFAFNFKTDKNWNNWLFHCSLHENVFHSSTPFSSILTLMSHAFFLMNNFMETFIQDFWNTLKFWLKTFQFEKQKTLWTLLSNSLPPYMCLVT